MKTSVDTFVNGDLKVKILGALLALTVVNPAYAADLQQLGFPAQEAAVIAAAP